MNPESVIRQLRNVTGQKFIDVVHVTTFSCYRDRKSGGTYEVRIEIHDAGPDAQPHLRYFCVATDEDGRKATGNPAGSVDEVLSHVHWFDLDKDE